MLKSWALAISRESWKDEIPLVCLMPPESLPVWQRNPINLNDRRLLVLVIMSFILNVILSLTLAKLDYSGFLQVQQRISVVKLTVVNQQNLFELNVA